jgi:hypothetical protein
MIRRLVSLAERSFRVHPEYSGFLISIGFLVLYVLVAPPLIWFIGRLFSPMLVPLGLAVM